MGAKDTSVGKSVRKFRLIYSLSLTPLLIYLYWSFAGSGCNIEKTQQFLSDFTAEIRTAGGVPTVEMPDVIGTTPAGPVKQAAVGDSARGSLNITLTDVTGETTSDTLPQNAKFIARVTPISDASEAIQLFFAEGNTIVKTATIPSTARPNLSGSWSSALQVVQNNVAAIASATRNELAGLYAGPQIEAAAEGQGLNYCLIKLDDAGYFTGDIIRVALSGGSPTYGGPLLVGFTQDATPIAKTWTADAARGLVNFNLTSHTGQVEEGTLPQGTEICTVVTPGSPTNQTEVTVRRQVMGSQMEAARVPASTKPLPFNGTVKDVINAAGENRVTLESLLGPRLEAAGFDLAARKVTIAIAGNLANIAELSTQGEASPTSRFGFRRLRAPTTNPDGPRSVARLIDLANDSFPGPDHITVEASGVIRPLKTLTVMERLTITAATGVVTALDGGNAGRGADGLVFTARAVDSSISDLIVGGYDGNGINSAAPRLQILRVTSGATGVITGGNRNGAFITAPATIDGSTFSGNRENGVVVQDTSAVLIRFTKIEKNPEGLRVQRSSDIEVRETEFTANSDGSSNINSKRTTFKKNNFVQNSGAAVGFLGSIEGTATLNTFDKNGFGVLVFEDSREIGITGNTFSSQTNLPVELRPPAGPNPTNQPNPGVGGNSLQNAPEILFATSTFASGRLLSAPGATFLIQVYASSSPAPSAQGESLVGTTKAFTGSDGTATFTCPFDATATVLPFVAGQATNLGRNESSEIGPSKPVSP